MNEMEERPEWDIFICHAHEDKPFVTLLAHALRHAGLRVWYDDFELSIGDGLRHSIDRGLAHSRFGVVILSKAFFRKRWTQYELSGLTERDLDKKVILPIWHEVDREDLIKTSPSLADKVAIKSTGNCPDRRGKLATLDLHRLRGCGSFDNRFLGDGGRQRRQQQGNLAMADDFAELALGHQQS